MDSSITDRPEAWVPHRGAMLLLDRVVHADAESVVAEVDVPFDGLFVRQGAVPAWIGIEYMAQAVSAWAGAQGRLRGEPPKLGFLLGTRKYEARCGAFPSGATLRIEARCEFRADSGLGMFDCRIEQDGREVAAAKLSVFEPDDPAAVLKGAQP
jgi:predicted hotdog family 3-hydroxylacyl-ACP dehydratase